MQWACIPGRRSPVAQMGGYGKRRCCDHRSAQKPFSDGAHEPGNNNSLVHNDVSALYGAGDGKLYIALDGAGFPYGTVPPINSPPCAAEVMMAPHCLTIRSRRSSVTIAVSSGSLHSDRALRAQQPYGRWSGICSIIRLPETPDRVTYALFEDRQYGLWVSTLAAEQYLWGTLSF